MQVDLELAVWISQKIPLNPLVFQIPPEVRCFRYVFGVQIPTRKVFGSLGNLKKYRRSPNRRKGNREKACISLESREQIKALFTQRFAIYVCFGASLISLGIQSPCQRMIGVYNHLLSNVFWFYYHSQKLIGSLGFIAHRKAMDNPS